MSPNLPPEIQTIRDKAIRGSVVAVDELAEGWAKEHGSYLQLEQLAGWLEEFMTPGETVLECVKRLL